MKKIKELFSTPKRTAITVVCIVAVLAAGVFGTVSVVQAFAEGSSIGEDNAKNFAFADAGVDPVAAKNVRTEFDFEQGQFVYEVEFTVEGTEYEYWIKASDGSVVKKQQEIMTADGSNAVVSAKITMDEAKEAAVKDAGLKLSDVTFTKEKLDLDDGISVYELDFYAGNTEYEYEIYADSGDIYSKSKEPYNGKTPAATASPAPGASETPKTTTSPAATTAPGQQSQPSQGGNTQQSQPSQSGNTQQSQPSQSGNTQQSQPSQGGNTQQSQPSQGSNTQQSQPSQSGSSQISLDAAKNAALSDAGVSASQVTFTKAKLDHDDGRYVYDIEFYTASQEFEYEISASDGAVLDRSVETLEHHEEDHYQGNSGGNTASGSYISVEEAKSAAVSHAGFSVSDVNFKKAKLDHDDGYMVYEIEFYRDGTEYEYTINASNGSVMDYDAERDD